MTEGSDGKADQPGVEYQPGQAGEPAQTGGPRHSPHGLPVSPAEYEHLKARALYEKTDHGPIAQEDPAANPEIDDEMEYSGEVIELEPGDEMPDGTIYAGISPDTHQPMYATPKDASLTFTFNAAKEYAADLNALDALGHNDWRVPTKNELNVLFENRNKGKLKGTFNETGSTPAGWYWSSSPSLNSSGWAQRFSTGFQLNLYRYYDSSLRCVR